MAKRFQRSPDIGGGRRPVAAFGQDQAAGLGVKRSTLGDQHFVEGTGVGAGKFEVLLEVWIVVDADSDHIRAALVFSETRAPGRRTVAFSTVWPMAL
jgi:hypothetical protein